MSNQNEENILALALVINEIEAQGNGGDIGPSGGRLWRYVLRCLSPENFDFLWALSKSENDDLHNLIMEHVLDDMDETSPEYSVAHQLDQYFSLYEEWTNESDLISQLVEACGHRHALGDWDAWLWMFCNLPIRENDLVLIKAMTPDQLEVLMPGSSYGSIENDPDIVKLEPLASRETLVDLDKRLNETYARFEEFILKYPEDWQDHF